jgi:hypothetical protein
MDDQHRPRIDPAPGAPEDYNDLMRFRRFALEPYTAFYVTRDDTLVLRVWSPTVANTTRLSLRYQGANGEVLPRFETFTDSTVGTTPAVHIIPNAEGTLLSASIETPAAQRGQVFVSLEIQRGLGTSDQTFGRVLISGYPGSTFRIGFPDCPPASPLDGRGWVVAVLVANPAAGADWVQTVPAGEQWIIRSVRAQLVTSAAAANRVPQLEVTDGAGHIVTLIPTTANQAASLTVGYNWFPEAQLINFNGQVLLPFPLEVRAQPGFTIQSVTTAIQAADQWSQIVILAERFITA